MPSSPRSTAFVILNPTSGSGAGRRIRTEIERELRQRGIDFQLVLTEGPGHAVTLAGIGARSGAACVVAAGGDGTIHEVANGLLAASAPDVCLGVLPIGTGNDFVKVIPGLRPRAHAYDTLHAGHTRAVDVGLAEWDGIREYFTNAMGTGIDVEVVRQLERSRHLPGGVVYLLALVRALARFEAVPVRVDLDGRTIDQRVLMLAACNGACVGGAFRLAPDATPDDGWLDVCVVDEVGVTGILRAVPRVLRGTHTELPICTMHRAKVLEFEIAQGRPFLFQLDGELRDTAGARHLRVEIKPNALRVASGPGPTGLRKT